MNYEKEYKEALERARLYHNVDKDNTLRLYARGTMEYLFPELKESEDEKIRKEIIEYIKTGTYHKSWIAWLEKQGEQKLINDTDEGIVKAVADTSILDMVEPNPAWSEEDEETLSRIRTIVRNNNSSRVEDILWLKSLKERMKGE